MFYMFLFIIYYFVLLRHEISYFKGGKYFAATSNYNYSVLYEQGVSKPIQKLAGNIYYSWYQNKKWKKSFVTVFLLFVIEHNKTIVSLSCYPLDSPICATASMDHNVILQRYKMSKLTAL